MQMSSKVEIERLLKNLRNDPINTDGSQDALLLPPYNFLMKISPDHQGKLHWFCSSSDEIAREAAIFLLRLFAYSNDQVTGWKKGLTKCLHGCCMCVQAFTEAKVTSRKTYFGAFSDNIVSNFYSAFESWEIEIINSSLLTAGVTITSQRTLADAPSAVVYHMLSTLKALQDPMITSLIEKRPPPRAIAEWPVDSPPPGLLLLLLHHSTEVRWWAKSHTSLVKKAMSKVQYIKPYEVVLNAITYAVSSARDTPSVMPSIDQTHTASFTSLFSRSSTILWSGLASVLRLLPSEALQSSKQNPSAVDLRRMIVGHLHDHAAHFSDVLRCMVYVIQKLDSRVWDDESADYAQVVFDAIKDNPGFANLMFTPDAMNEKPWFLCWFSEYLRALWDMPIFGEVLLKIVGFFCGELQHERFEKTRPAAMVAAIRFLIIYARKAYINKAARQSAALASVIDIHSDILVSVALSRDYNKPQWSKAREKTLELLRLVFLIDMDNLANTVTQLANMLPPVKAATVAVYQPIRAQIWEKVFDRLQADSSDGIAVMIATSARLAHVDVLAEEVFNPASLPRGSSDSVREAFHSTVKDVNRSLLECRSGFLNAVTRFSHRNPSSIILKLLERPDMVKDIMALMLSPVEDLHDAAQTLIGQAFDVDVRMDCFRALLENLPGPALRGVLEFMETFNQYAPQVPEACSVSKALVRCMTDVIEVLCNSPDGLLLKESFLPGFSIGSGSADVSQPPAQLPKLWGLMTTAIAVIFKRTPAWAVYFDNEVMVEWMRDAVIFGRDMLAQRRVIESAALAASSQDISFSSPRKLSHIGRTNVNDLQNVLLELVRWLRLTDEELLHQSFALLQSLLDCFRETKTPPSPSALAKLTKFVDDGRLKSRESQHTRLDSARLSELEDALASFDQDADVELISDSSFKPLSLKKGEPSRALKSKAHRSPRESMSVQKSITGVDSVPKTTAATTTKLRNLSDQSNKILKTVQPELHTSHRTIPLSIKGEPKNEGTMGKSRQSSSRSSVASSAPSDNSESESEDEEDESSGKAGLNSLNKFQLSPHATKKPAERRQIKFMEAPTNKRNPIQERLNRREDARRIALRLKPDISPLHRMILGWNYDHDGPDPPTTGAQLTLIRVPDRFTDHGYYLRVFEPLLMRECWSQIVKSKEEAPAEVYGCKITSRQFVDDWLELDASMSDGVKKDWRLAETDIVLLRQQSGPKCIMGRASNFKSSAFGIQIGIRCHLDPANVDPGLQVNTQWRISKVFSLSTLHREFAALVALPYYDLCESILRPRLSEIPSLDPKDVSRAVNSYQVNEPQAKAILASMKTDGFSLIQGPPGTGKTWTICGLVGAFMSSRTKTATIVQAGRTSVQPQRPSPKKLLICAPSNAAIDEVAKRLIDGVRDAQGSRVVPMVVRIGADASMNITVKDNSLDSLVDQKLNSNAKGNKDTGVDIAALRAEIDLVKHKKQEKQEELSTIHDNASKTLALEEDIKSLNARRMTLSQQFDRLKDKRKSDNRTLDATRRKFRHEVLSEADVICSTLSGAGHEVLSQYDFEMVIIDEAAQSIELSSLIPLKYRCKRCIMVGDPQQLPPTVLSAEASKWGYDQSLFVRIQKHQPNAVHLLSIQYRMHPEISQLPSRLFYSFRLKDGPDMEKKTAQPWHSHKTFGVYKFFSVTRGKEEAGRAGHSLFNRAECQVTLALYDRLRLEFSSCNFDYRIGIVSMYRAQVVELRRTFEAKYGSDVLSRVDFNTVDGFQGQEKDIIILTCVRAGPGVQSVGFLADTRRMNVAITRSRSSLFIIGHSPTLERSNESWKHIVQDARSRSCLMEVDVADFRSAASGVAIQKPRKSISSAPDQSKRREIVQPIPVDLSTPKDFKSIRPLPQRSIGHDRTPKVAPEAPATMAIDFDRSNSAHAAGLHEDQPNVEQNNRPPSKARKAEEEVTHSTKPRMLPAKRPKAAASLFIPSKRPHLGPGSSDVK